MAEPRPGSGPSGEPEKLVLPAGGVQYLLELALRTELGGAFWRGFVTAHGAPSWIVAGALSLKAQDAEVVRTKEGQG